MKYLALAIALSFAAPAGAAFVRDGTWVDKTPTMAACLGDAAKKKGGATQDDYDECVAEAVDDAFGEQ